MKGYIELQVWQKAMDLPVMIYEISAVMPSTERFSMTSQMQRAATSVPANIAEGYQRGTRKDYARFIGIAQGSLAETETFLRLATRVGHLQPSQSEPVLIVASELGRMLTRLKQKLDVAPPNP